MTAPLALPAPPEPRWNPRLLLGDCLAPGCTRLVHVSRYCCTWCAHAAVQPDAAPRHMPACDDHTAERSNW